MTTCRDTVADWRLIYRVPFAFSKLACHFLINPMGLPLAAIWLLGEAQSLKFAIPLFLVADLIRTANGKLPVGSFFSRMGSLQKCSVGNICAN